MCVELGETVVVSARAVVNVGVEAFSTSARRLIISSIIGGSSVALASQPDSTGESPVTTASRSLATAL